MTLTDDAKQLRKLARRRNQLWAELTEQRARGEFSGINHTLTINELNDVLFQIRRLKGEE